MSKMNKDVEKNKIQVSREIRERVRRQNNGYERVPGSGKDSMKRVIKQMDEYLNE